MIDAAPTTSAPAARATSIVSRVEPASRHDVLDDQDPFTGRERETAPQHQLAVLSFGEDGADAERPPDFLPDDDAAERRREHDLRTEATHAVGNFRSAGLGFGRVLQDQGALQIPGTVQSGGQPKVSFQQRTGLAKAIEHGISSD